VSVIDAKTRQILKKLRFDVPGLTREEVQPVGMRVTSDGKTVFVALGPANRVAVVDADTFEIRKYILVGQRVWHMALTPDEKYLFTANGNSNDVTVIDVGALKAIKSIPVGQAPLGVAAAPN
jgi:YVTN family beta-propeller protein